MIPDIDYELLDHTSVPFFWLFYVFSEEIKENNRERMESLNKQAVFRFMGTIFASSTGSQRK